jgi:hypothetical protein
MLAKASSKLPDEGRENSSQNAPLVEEEAQFQSTCGLGTNEKLVMITDGARN